LIGLGRVQTAADRIGERLVELGFSLPDIPAQDAVAGQGRDRDGSDKRPND